MKVAHIVPTKYFPSTARFAYHMALAQRLLNDFTYRESMKLLHRAGAFIIVDNGVGETDSGELGELPVFKDVVEVANEIGADEIVLPDDVASGEHTLELFREHAALVPERRRMVVPHGKTIEEWVACASEFLSDCGFATLGASRTPERQGWGRGTVLKLVDPHIHGKHVHLLGVHLHPGTELRTIANDYPGIRGVDSAIAAAYTQRGWQLRAPVDKHVAFRSLAPNELIEITLFGLNLRWLTDFALGLP